MPTVLWLALGLMAFSLLLYASGVACLWRHTHPRVIVEPDRFPGLSILKPLKGLEEELEANLESFFRLDYPGPLELVLGSLEPDDRALAVARRVASGHPEVAVRFVGGGPTLGLNPKVSNLANLARAASHDLLLLSDANVRVQPAYCRRVVSELLAEKGSLLTSLVIGVGEKSVGAALDNLHLTAFISPAMSFALKFAGITCVVGKTMLLYGSELSSLGGFELVRDILAEDFVLGAAYQKAGKRVLLSPTPVTNVNVHTSVDRFMSRHARWLKMRAVLHMPGMIADLAGNPIMVGAIAVAATGFDSRAIAAFGLVTLLKPIADALALRRLRGRWESPAMLALVPLKDILIGGVWPYALVSRSVEWRGVRLRLGKGSVLGPARAALPVRAYRRLTAPFRS